MPANFRENFEVRLEGGTVFIDGDLVQKLTLRVDRMLRGLQATQDARSLDLMCIAAGCYALDRAVKRQSSRANERGIRKLRVCFAVLDWPYWKSAEAANRITEILVFLTGDNWLISFKRRVAAMRPVQAIFNLNWPNPPRRVALYSGGLDSAAGLASRFRDDVTDYLLLTIGHQSAIRRDSFSQVKSLQNLLPNQGSVGHASLLVRLQGGVSKLLRNQEQSQRARGFLFCAAAAVVASACNIEEIEIFENGAGAINLPLMEGMLRDGLATRGAHPGFLAKMSSLASDSLGKKLRFVLPFSGLTKAEMIGKLIDDQRLIVWAQSSRSCVHTSLRTPNIRHCGTCPACIERRQAFAAAGVEDHSAYKKDLFKLAAPLQIDYLRCYLDNARAWIDGDAVVAERLKRHLILTDIKDDDGRIHQLMRRHAQEINNVFGKLMHVQIPKAENFQSFSARPTQSMSAPL
jgi:7-cyano-7-deazaguanine synthase in queuosine biosynthesis